MVRDVNAAADAGEVRKDDVPALLKVLEQFDEIFAVLKDDDAGKVRGDRRVGARRKACEDKISPQTAELAKAAALSDAEVEQLVAEHSQARKTRDFARSDAIRAAAGRERHHPGEHQRRRALEAEVEGSWQFRVSCRVDCKRSADVIVWQRPDAGHNPASQA